MEFLQVNWGWILLDTGAVWFMVVAAGSADHRPSWASRMLTAQRRAS